MEICFEWMLAGFVDAKAVSLFASQHNVVNCIVIDTMYQKENAVQYVKILFLQLITLLAAMQMVRFKLMAIAGGKMTVLFANVLMENLIVLPQHVDRAA